MDDFSPGALCFEHKFGVMMIGDGRDKTKPQSGSGHRPAGIETNETLQHPRAIGFGYTGAIVEDRKKRMFAAHADSDADNGGGRTMLDGIDHEVG